MSNFFGKYMLVGLVILAFLFYLYTSYLLNQRDKARSDFIKVNEQMAQLIKVNDEQTGQINSLNKQLALNNAYINSLEQRRTTTKQLFTHAENSFKKATYDNQTINDWAKQSLPSGLY